MRQPCPPRRQTRGVDLTGDVRPLPLTGRSPEAVLADGLGALIEEPVLASPAFRGGQRAADAALARFTGRGYAAARNEVWPPERRGASRLSPYIRHGLLDLPRVWQSVAGAPISDRERFREELLWQEYARHLYARLGRSLFQPLRYWVDPDAPWAADPWDRRMACVDATLTELEQTGWIVNQTRMWLASQWSVRHGAGWRAGAALFHRHLLDGSHAANLAGWQWTVGAATGRRYTFRRGQVERRAPGMCAGCALRRACPIEAEPPALDPPPRPSPDPRLRRDPDPGRTAGPVQPRERRPARQVLLTMESLGTADPALRAHPDLPVVVAFDPAALRRWRLSSKRVLFWIETLAELAGEREVRAYVGSPRAIAGPDAAVTFAPVPGFAPLAVSAAVLHPWRWLVRPGEGPLTSFTAWRRRITTPS